MLLNQKLMRFELPFKIRVVEEINSRNISYKVFVFRDKLFSELLSGNNVTKVVPITSSDAPDLLPCMFQKWQLRGPNALYSVKSSRRGDILQFCWRSDCNACEMIKEGKIIDIYDDVDSLALVYRKSKEYYAIIDDLSGFTMIRLSDSKPRKIMYRNGVLILSFSDYIRIVSPITGIVDVALTENVDPLGIDIAGNSSTVLLHSRSSGIVFSLSRTRDLEPLASCNEVISIRDISGKALVLCDFESLNSSFYPFYAGKIFIDIFKETDSFSIINPYILSFVRKDNKIYFIGALIEPHPIYISVLQNNGVSVKTVLTTTNLKGIEKSLLESIENLYGPIIASSHSEELVASVYTSFKDDICFGTHCGKCIVRISKLNDIISTRLVINLGNNIYEPSYTSERDLIFTIDDEHACSLLSELNKLSVCNKNTCVTIPIVYNGIINAQLTCQPQTLSDIDELRITCKVQGDVEKIVRYTPCSLIHAGNNLRLYIRENPACYIGLVTPDGFVIREKLSYDSLGKMIAKEIPELASISLIGSYKDSLLVKFSYQGRGLIPLKINGVFGLFDASYVVLRLSGSTNVQLRDALGIREVHLRLPYSGKVVIEPSKKGLLRIRCIDSYCILFCGSTVITESIISIDLKHIQEKGCQLVIIGSGITRILNIDPVSEALKLGILIGRRLAQLL